MRASHIAAISQLSAVSALPGKVGSFSGSIASPNQVATEAGGKSSGTLSGPRPFDLHRFKAVFPDKWAAFLKSHFHTSARVAAFFDVDDKTARNWLAGVNSPSGPHAIYAVEALPGLREHLMEARA